MGIETLIVDVAEEEDADGVTVVDPVVATMVVVTMVMVVTTAKTVVRIRVQMIITVNMVAIKVCSNSKVFLSLTLFLGGYYCQLHGHGATHDWNHCFQNPDRIQLKGAPNQTGNKNSGAPNGNNSRGGKSGF